MTLHRTVLMVALAAGLAFGAMGCTIAATPATLSVAPSVSTTHVVHHTPAPTRVYYEGRWLHYRSNAYYYRSGTTWVTAPRVPTHVVSYHRPGRPVHVTTSHARPAPTHVRSYHRPAHVRSSGPTHVRRTVSNRRTYYRR